MSANPGALPGWFNRRNDDNTHTGTAHQPRDAATPDSIHAAPDQSGSTAKATTGGGKEDQTPVVVWEAANRMEAEIVAGRLHSEGIPAIIRGEALGTIYGLTTGSLAAATVLVPAALADKATALLANTVEWDDGEPLEDADEDADLV
jgi:hypothetical protein